MLWNGKVTINICMRKSFSRFYCHICHTHINLLVYNGLMVAVDPISIITLLPPIATPKPYLIMGRMLLKLRHDVAVTASGRSCCNVVT